jgi:hypothetical protein
MTKTQAISKMILDAYGDNIGSPNKEKLKSAIDAVLFPGAYDSLVDSLYDDLRAKAAA